MIVGMRTLEFKKIEKEMQSKKSWEQIGVPEELIKNLVNEPLAYSKPSLIQSFGIPMIQKEQQSNYIFQSMNGSGKTGAFSIPAIMRVDKALDET